MFVNFKKMFTNFENDRVSKKFAYIAKNVLV